MLLLAVQSTITACKAEYREQYYDGRIEHRKAVRVFVEKVEHAFSSPMSCIDGIAFDANLSDTEKVSKIQEILRAQGGQTGGTDRDRQVQAGIRA